MILNAGLPLELKDGKLFLGGAPLDSSVRTSQDMKDVADSSSDGIIYAMYRNISGKAHRGIMSRHNMRYDVTVIFPRMLGSEFAKTLGHYHSLSKNVSYTEIYEVLAGKAHFMLQKVSGNKVEDAVVIEAEEGDAVIVPPGYGHVTINPTGKAIAVADLQSASATAYYGPVKKLRGAAYYDTVKGFVENPNYTNHSLRVIKAAGIKQKFLGSGKPIYTIFVETPEKFGFLTHPEKFAEMLDSSLSG